MMLAVVAALRDTAPLGALVATALGTAAFTLGHAPPMGPAGMGLILLGIVWAEFRPRPAEALESAASNVTEADPTLRHQRPPLGHGFGEASRHTRGSPLGVPGPHARLLRSSLGAGRATSTGPGLDRAIHASPGQHTPHPRTRCLPP